MTLSFAGLVALLVLFWSLMTGIDTVTQTPAAPYAPGTPVTLAPGEGVTARDGTERLDLQFAAVVEDSRCPVDVTCVWAGQATVRVHLGARGTHDIVTGAGAPGAVEVDGWRVEVVAVEPEPHSARPIAAGDYRVTLRIAR
ncbi:MAG: hypothetical protein AMXMBFR23_00750 [Chloroflexota bacterium]